MKSTSLMVLLFALSLHAQRSQPPTPGAEQQQSEQENTHGNGIQPQTQPQLQVTPMSSVGVNIRCPACSAPNADKSKAESNGNPSNKRWRDPNWWLVGLTTVLALIALGQACLFFWQLRMMKSSLSDSKVAAEAARDAANAGLQSASISMNAERAWVIDEVGPSYAPPKFDPVIATVGLVNRGRVPARITDLRMNFELLAIPEDADISLELPEFDNDQLFLELGTNGLILAPQQGEEFTIDLKSVKLTPDQWKCLTEAYPFPMRLFLYGKAIYNDGFVEGRITQFCYVWQPFTGLIAKGPARFRRIGPAGFVDAT